MDELCEEMVELGRRALACKAWRELPGIYRPPWEDLCASRNLEGGAIAVFRDGVWEIIPEWCEWEQANHPPDLDDPATIGCVLEMVRKAWGGWLVEVEEHTTGDFGVLCYGRIRQGVAMESARHYGATLGEALVAALEGAP